MRKSKNRIADIGARELARGGRTIPPAVMRSAKENTKTRVAGVSKETLRLCREAAAFRRKLQKPLDRKDPQVAHAVAGLRGIGDRLAKRKVLAPAAARLTPGIIAGSYSLRLTPGYDYGDVNVVAPDSRNSAFVQRSIGALGFEIYTDNPNVLPFANATIGSFFFPMFGPARMRASINPTLAYAWWTVATGSDALTLAVMSMNVYSILPDGTYVPNVNETGGGIKSIWYNQDQQGLLEFGVQSVSDNPMTAGVDVDTDHFYLITLECLGEAFSLTTDGFTSVAGGILNMMLPYIDIDVQLIPKISQF
jgi:hypothetical protein